VNTKRTWVLLAPGIPFVVALIVARSALVSAVDMAQTDRGRAMSPARIRRPDLRHRSVGANGGSHPPTSHAPGRRADSSSAFGLQAADVRLISRDACA
jgi:hypothetical protein